MTKKTIFKVLIDLKQKFIECLKPGDFKNHDGKSFTRKRILTIGRLVLIILRNSPMPLQVRLDDFFEETEHKEETVSKQAFSQARAKLDPDVVKSSFELTARTLASCDDLELWKGKYRLCAIDGSDIALENEVPIIEHFGCSGSKKNAATAMTSLCFDALNNIIYDAGLYPYTQSEREAARAHIPVVQALPRPDGVQNLFIFDRGYPSRALFTEFIDTGVLFLMRVRKNFNNEIDLVDKNEKIMFTHKNK
jgi:hypothetical protein